MTRKETTFSLTFRCVWMRLGIQKRQANLGQSGQTQIKETWMQNWAEKAS